VCDRILSELFFQVNVKKPSGKLLFFILSYAADKTANSSRPIAAFWLNAERSVTNKPRTSMMPEILF